MTGARYIQSRNYTRLIYFFIGLFVGWFVCLTVSRINAKGIDEYSSNFGSDKPLAPQKTR